MTQHPLYEDLSEDDNYYRQKCCTNESYLFISNDMGILLVNRILVLEGKNTGNIYI